MEMDDVAAWYYGVFSWWNQPT